jgi:hypothetical protein
MKISKIIIGLFLTVGIFVISCVKEFEPAPKFSASTGTFTITPSATTVAALAKDSIATALTLTWTDPKYAVGLKKSKFTVMASKTGTNFATFVSKEFTGALTGALTGKDLNGMALFSGGLIGQSITLDIMVVASQDNNNEQKKSNVTQVAVTPFSGFSVVSSPTSITPNPAKPSENAVTLSWTVGFNGYKGVVKYELQHAKTGTSFAAPTTIAVTGFSKPLTHLEINTIALGYNIPPSVAGDVDFRVKATNELGAINYSSTTKVSVTPYVSINSVGIIGDATPGSWDVDTDLYRPDVAGKPSEWTTIIYLIGGKKALFRQDDQWDNKWGVGGKGGADIPIATSGFYKADLNVATGVYSFTPVTVPTISSLSVIGDATAGGWGADTNLTQDATNTNIYTGTVALTVGSIKFRETGNWGINWGGPAGDNDPVNYPSAWGKGNGGNIKINTAGTYFVRINIATGEYAFGPADRGTPYADIGVIGDSTPGGWANDTNLIRNPSNPFKWSGKLTLTSGLAKFRADNDWGVNWGAKPFPLGIGVQNGDNIENVTAGTYQINFNSLTGEYTFTK